MVSDEKIRDSFQKIKGEINFLAEEILALRVSIDQIQVTLEDLKKANKKEIIQSSIYPAHPQRIGNFPAHNLDYIDKLNLNSQFSIGNKGVPADRQQTDNRQTTEEFIQDDFSK